MKQYGLSFESDVMHLRNPYNEPPDFTDLARHYPPLRPQYASFQLRSLGTTEHILFIQCFYQPYRVKYDRLQKSSSTKVRIINASSLFSLCTTACRRLTEALCHRDFGLSLELPDDRLCPPVSLVPYTSPFHLMPVAPLGAQ